MDNPLCYAILFRTHFWDDFVERQLRRLCQSSGGGRVFVVVDETRWRVTGIHYKDVIRITESHSEAEGYLCSPHGDLFRHNADYQLYHFFDKYPDYDFVFVCEYDCVVNIAIDEVIKTMIRDGLSFVGECIRTPSRASTDCEAIRAYYAEDFRFLARVTCCAAFSQDFVRQLQIARRDHTRRALDGQMADTIPGENWPSLDTLVGAELARFEITEACLSDFGDTIAYDRAPPHPEFALSALSEFAVVHPVVESRYYLRAIAGYGWKAADLFDCDSGLHLAMERYEPSDVVPMFVRHFIESNDLGSLELLRDYAARRCRDGAHRLFNVALGKPTTQSSTSMWSRRPSLAGDASGAVDGQISGHYGFHTDIEQEPWWCVDLEGLYPVREIHIYNRLDVPNRSRSIVATVSSDLSRWRTIFQHAGDASFGGADGRPLQIKLGQQVEMRFLRLHLPKRELLHLDEVEIYV